jgi:hypothetical protein
MGPAGISPQQRSQMELDLLNQYFRGLTKSRKTNGTPFYPEYVDIPMRTKAGNRYMVRLVIPAAYPDAMPTMLVVSPKPLLDYNRRPLLATNRSMHVLGAIDGCTCVCHCERDRWDASLALQMVAMKGGIWLEAYEGHRRTGKQIDHWLSHTDPPRPSAAAARVQTPRIVIAPSPKSGLLQRLRRLFDR